MICHLSVIVTSKLIDSSKDFLFLKNKNIFVFYTEMICNFLVIKQICDYHKFTKKAREKYLKLIKISWNKQILWLPHKTT